MAVTRAISGSPLATENEAVGIADKIALAGHADNRAARRCIALRVARSSVSFAVLPPASAPNSARLAAPPALQRGKLFGEARPRRRTVDEHRVPATQGMRPLVGRGHRCERSLPPLASKVPRLTSSASARSTKALISPGASVIDGTAPAASSMLAVKFCATLVGDAMHPRPALAHAIQDFGSDDGHFALRRSHLSLRRHDPDQVRWVGSRLSAQPTARHPMRLQGHW